MELYLVQLLLELVLLQLVQVLLLERAVHELGFDLEQRPQIVALPLQAIKELLAAQ